MSGCGAEPGLIGVDDALELLLEQTVVLDSKRISVHQALGCYVAEDIYAPNDLPLFDQSAVDGYAICSATHLKKGQVFECIAEVKAGDHFTLSLQQGQAVRIFTGAQIPKGTATIARQEYIRCLDHRVLTVERDIALDVDIRYRGEELSHGQRLAPKGQHVTVGVIAALCMAGIQEITVYQSPRIAVVVSGDEISDLTTDITLSQGKVFDANTPLIMNWLHSAGQSADHFYVKDTLQEVQQLIQKLSQTYDVILTTGGVSVGDYDFIRPATLKLGFQQVFWKVKQKPGKPMFFATLQKKEQRRCYLLGLPGNPAAVYVGLFVYVRTLIAALQGNSQALSWYTAQLGQDVKPDLRARFLRMQVKSDEAFLQVDNLKNQQSHMLSNLMQANSLVYLEANRSYLCGETVKILLV
ncbi:molybdopterin molybdotransferase MoeA [Acinetobacter rathckeae]|uniref:molybdopterin molybdotransferase MoeA n=1 Tax=Acinetobacter rathckeae TaxID=2605272 RepID=UPI0018A2D4D6|nr:molybdopterin molybdotransferase MoeA [Acinetobacter rathckeae]MBF7687311.1 molybdopterin molybdotransferase MoeA [Acinetobacter rathckeae]MBF7696158.1 molybdopterin molybdotransferase MoeA [Acinetobacter rathckeae]